MEIRNWNPKAEHTKEEEYLLKRLKRNKRLFAFLRKRWQRSERRIWSPIRRSRADLICRPWNVSNDNGLFSKADFHINLRDKLITCPGGQTESFDFGQTVAFDAHACATCSLRSRCTNARADRGRTVHIAHDEKLQRRLRRQASSPAGRQQLRERVVVEHKLAHLAQRQGHRARYRGTRKNLFNLRRAAAIQNLEVIQCRQQRHRKAA
jgi:hypothetical protein